MFKKYLFSFIAISFSFLTAHAQMMPLEVGNEWEFDISSNYSSCKAGVGVTKIHKLAQISGRSAFEASYACNGRRGYMSEVSSGKIDIHYNGNWYRYLDTPLVEGHVWNEFRAQALWTRVEDITVPAGTFTNCWRKIRQVPYTHWEEYCDGIGMVRSEVIDMGQNYIKMELKSFSLN